MQILANRFRLLFEIINFVRAIPLHVFCDCHRQQLIKGHWENVSWAEQWVGERGRELPTPHLSEYI